MCQFHSKICCCTVRPWLFWVTIARDDKSLLTCKLLKMALSPKPVMDFHSIEENKIILVWSNSSPCSPSHTSFPSGDLTESALYWWKQQENCSWWLIGVRSNEEGFGRDMKPWTEGERWGVARGDTCSPTCPPTCNILYQPQSHVSC